MQVIRTRAKESVLTSYQRVLILKRSADLRTNRDSIINKNRDRLHFSESVLTSDQRVLVLKRAAALQGEIPCRCITG